MNKEIYIQKMVALSFMWTFHRKCRYGNYALGVTASPMTRPLMLCVSQSELKYPVVCFRSLNILTA